IYANVAGQQTIVRDDDVVSNKAIVTDVRAGHQEILVPNFRRTSIGAAPVDRAVLADDITVSDFDTRLSFLGKRNILWRHTDDRAVSDEISTADRNFAF